MKEISLRTVVGTLIALLLTLLVVVLTAASVDQVLTYGAKLRSSVPAVVWLAVLSLVVFGGLFVGLWDKNPTIDLPKAKVVE